MSVVFRSGQNVYSCDLHKNEVLFVCKPCQRLVCSVCLISEHNTHEMMLSSEKVEKNQAILDELISKTEDQIKIVDGNIKRLERCGKNAKDVADELKKWFSDEIDKVVFSKPLPNSTSYNKDKTKLQEVLACYRNKKSDLKYLTENDVEEVNTLTENYDMEICHINYKDRELNMQSLRPILQNFVQKIGLEGDVAKLVDKISCSSKVTCFAVSGCKMYICAGKHFYIKNLYNPDEGSVEETYEGLENIEDILVPEDKLYFYINQNVSKSIFGSLKATEFNVNSDDITSKKHPEFVNIDNVDCFSLAGHKILASRDDDIFEIENKSLIGKKLEYLTEKRMEHLKRNILHVVKLENEKYVTATTDGLNLIYKGSVKLSVCWYIIFSSFFSKSLSVINSTRAYLCFDAYGNIYVISSNLEWNIFILDGNLNPLSFIKTEFAPKKIQAFNDDKLCVSFFDEPSISVYKLNFIDKRADKRAVENSEMHLIKKRKAI